MEYITSLFLNKLNSDTYDEQFLNIKKSSKKLSKCEEHFGNFIVKSIFETNFKINEHAKLETLFDLLIFFMKEQQDLSKIQKMIEIDKDNKDLHTKIMESILENDKHSEINYDIENVVYSPKMPSLELCNCPYILEYFYINKCSRYLSNYNTLFWYCIFLDQEYNNKNYLYNTEYNVDTDIENYDGEYCLKILTEKKLFNQKINKNLLIFISKKATMFSV